MTPWWLMVLPLQDAGTRPRQTAGFQLGAGFALLDIEVAPLPLLPVFTGEAAVEFGLTDHVDLGLRYTTFLGFNHRLGPELQVGTRLGPRVALGARLHPSVRVAGTAGPEGAELGGDVSAPVAALVTVRHGGLAWTFEGGLTTQFLLFERLEGRGFVDPRPFLGTADLAVELAWRQQYTTALAVRAEVGFALAPDAPFGFGVARPRLVFSGHFGRRSPSPPK